MAGNHSPRHSPQGQASSHPSASSSSSPSIATTQSSLVPATSAPTASSSTDSLNRSSGTPSSNEATDPDQTPFNTTSTAPLPTTPVALKSPPQRKSVTSPYKRPSDSDSSSSNPPPLSTSKASASGPSQKRQRRAPKGKNAEDTAASKPTEADEDSEATRMANERPRLSEQEKKNNHIASEQKRRMAIREGFDRLTEIVPGLEGQGRSESIVLKKSVDHMRDVLNERQQLIQRIQALGGEIPPELR